MKHTLNFYAFIAIAMLSVVMANSQTGGNATKRYQKGGLAFDYPEAWELTDSNSQDVQTVTLARKGSLAQIALSVQDGLTPTCDFESERKKIADALLEKVATQINNGAAHRASPVTTQIAGSQVKGAQLQGALNRKPITVAVYTIRLNRRFVGLTFTAAPNDEEAQAVWKTIRTSLSIEPGVITVIGTTDPGNSRPTISSGVTNGKIVSMPQPEYPKIARSAHAAGTVIVQVTIDETGNVISAHAVSGHPLLQAASVAAAQEAKFSPTKLCGEPVRVTGVITYNFVAR